MCGFAGFSDYLATVEEKKTILTQMTDRIAHRGPDMSGAFCDDFAALGFRRLSIIDLSQDGAQPMWNEDRTLCLVFNGEIYNFEALREQLTALGHTFASKTDTEVILHGYESWGCDVLLHLRGMFSFVLYDLPRRRLFGARDIFGIKPHYYCKCSDGTFLFGSEIKAFLPHPSFCREVNRDALRPYLTFQYSSLAETFFRGVYKLQPAHYYLYENGEIIIRPYWSADFEKEQGDFESFVDTVDKTVLQSVALHRISDVKVGSFLSGGVDSSYITAALMPSQTFSVGFLHQQDPTFNESGYARELSDRLGIENISKIIDPDECFAAFPEIQYHMDEPQSNPSSVPLWFLAKLARENVTVVLSGEGADELFAGYDWYADTRQVAKFKKIVPGFLRRALAAAVRPLPPFKGRSFLLRASGKAENYFLGEAFVFPDRQAKAILAPDCRGGKSARAVADACYAKVRDKDELTQKQYLDMNLWLPGDILLKADKMSMAHSLELRVPFLDKVVMETAEKIPAEYKVNEIDTKYVLRAAAGRHLPAEWATRKKRGFPVPIRYWLQQEKYASVVRGYFESDYAALFFDRKKILALLDEHVAKKANNARKIWTVYTFLVWYKRFFIDEA